MTDVTMKTEKPKRKLPFRMIAGLLAFALLVSIGANAAVRVKIQPGDETEAATNYLADRTDYVRAGRLRRIQEKLKALRSPTTLEDYYRLAGTQIAEEKYGQALDSVAKCLALYDGDNAALYQDLLLKKGCLLVLLERDEEALSALDLALKENPDLPDAYLIRAQIYAGREEMEPLAQALEAYLVRKPEDQEIRALLAQAMFTGADYAGATTQYRQILSEAKPESDTAEIAYLYAMACIQMGDYSSAEESLNRALEQNDALEGIYYYRGVCRMSRGDYSGAISDLTASLRQNSLPQLCYYSRGVCTLMTTNYNYAAAQADLQAAADYRKTDADAGVTQQAQSLMSELAAAQQAADEAARLAAEEKARLAAEEAAAQTAQQPPAPDPNAAVPDDQYEPTEPSGVGETMPGGKAELPQTEP